MARTNRRPISQKHRCSRLVDPQGTHSSLESSSDDTDQEDDRQTTTTTTPDQYHRPLYRYDTDQRRKGMFSSSSSATSSSLDWKNPIRSSLMFGQSSASSSSSSNPFSVRFSVENVAMEPINPFVTPFSVPTSTNDLNNNVVATNPEEASSSSSCRNTIRNNNSNNVKALEPTFSDQTNSKNNNGNNTTLATSSEIIMTTTTTTSLTSNSVPPPTSTTSTITPITTESKDLPSRYDQTSSTTTSNTLNGNSSVQASESSSSSLAPLVLGSLPTTSSATTSTPSSSSSQSTTTAASSNLGMSESNVTTNNTALLSKPSFVFGGGLSTRSTTSTKSTTPSTSSSVDNSKKTPFSIIGTPSSTATSLNKVDTNNNLSTYDVFVNKKDFYLEETPFSFSKLASHANFSFGTRFSTVNPKNCIKKYNRDLLFGTDVFAFIPYLELVVPNFTHHVLLNQRLIQTLTKSEQKCLQFIIDFIVNRDVYVPNQTLSLHDVISCAFLVNRAKGELVEFKTQYLITQFKREFCDKSAIDTLELIDSYLEREKEAPKEIISGFLQRIQRFCLEYVGTNSSLPCFDIEKDPRIEKYLVKIYRFKNVASLTWTEQSICSAVKKDLSCLFKDPILSDVKITIGDGKFIECHKTVLSSASEFFETQFNSPVFTDEECDSRHLQEIGVEPHIMKYIVKYAYECFDPILVPSVDAIPLLKTAHLYRMKGLVDACLSIFNRNRQSYLSIIDSLSFYLDDPMLEPVREMLIQVGAANLEALFKTSDLTTEELMKIPHDMLVKITQLYFQLSNRHTFALTSSSSPLKTPDSGTTSKTSTAATNTSASAPMNVFYSF
nr:unnamed protein product [Naegleria fowleri]